MNQFSTWSLGEVCGSLTKIITKDFSWLPNFSLTLFTSGPLRTTARRRRRGHGSWLVNPVSPRTLLRDPRSSRHLHRYLRGERRRIFFPYLLICLLTFLYTFLFYYFVCHFSLTTLSYLLETSHKVFPFVSSLFLLLITYKSETSFTSVCM